jgi:hypothetical protein
VVIGPGSRSLLDGAFAPQGVRLSGTTGYGSAFPRHDLSGFLHRQPPRKTEGAGRPGVLLRPQPSVRKMRSTPAKSLQVSRNGPALPAQWFTAYRALSLASGLVSRHRLADRAARLDSSVGESGPRAFAVRADIARHASRAASIAFHPAVVAIASAPLVGWSAGIMILIWGRRQVIF